MPHSYPASLAAVDGSVTGWLRQAQTGDGEAIRKIWERYFRRLAALARQRLAGTRGGRGTFDEEDIASTTFAEVLRSLCDDRDSSPQDRFEFWALLRLKARRRAIYLVRAEGAAKRGGGRGDQATNPRRVRSGLDLDQVGDRLGDPQLIAAISEECHSLLDSLGDDEWVSVVLWKLEGLTNAEIAGRLGYSLRTVERMVRGIRARWDRLQQAAAD